MTTGRIVYHEATKLTIVVVGTTERVETYHAVVEYSDLQAKLGELGVKLRDTAATAGAWVEDEDVEAGDLRLHGGVLYECLQPHRTQADWTPDVAVSLWQVVPADQPAPGEWGPGLDVAVDDQLDHDGITYRALHPHTTQLGWEPDGHANLWAVVAGEEPQPWVQPQGAHDAYALGARVKHNGQTWESTTPDNVWEPGVFGWVVV